jgi:hypothetical protein
MEQPMKKKKKAVFATNGVGTMAANGVEPQDAGSETIPDGAAQRNAASLRPGGGVWDGSASAMPAAQAGQQTGQMEEGVQLDVSDFANALFEGEELSDSFKEKCIAIFEAAVNEKVAVMEQAMLDASKRIIEEQVASSVQTITEGVDKYLTYVCEEWMTENKLAVESGMKAELVENFIFGLRDLFENSFIDVPEEKYNVVDELFEANSDLESKLNEQLAENIQLKNQLIAHQCAEVFVEASKGLADTEVEKFASLAEGIEFDSVEQYAEKIKVLRESYFRGDVSERADETVSESLNESVSTTNGVIPEMDAYVRTIKNQLKLTNNKQVL